MRKISIVISVLTSVYMLVSCKKFLEIDPPKTDLIKKTVFESDQTAISAVSNLYYDMSNTSFASGSTLSITYLSALSADELTYYNLISDQMQFDRNALQPGNSTLNTSFWSALYQYIYKANSILEGIEGSTSLTTKTVSRLKGEALFIRAFAHFYLANLFGNIPIVVTTDYRTNGSISRSPALEVYKQIRMDLEESYNLLDSNYLDVTNSNLIGERGRVNKFAVSSMLARVHLYEKNWEKAEFYASDVIDSKSMYRLEALDNVFLRTSKEAIWQLSRDNGNTNDATTYLIPSTATKPPNSALNTSFVNTFDQNDQRRQKWIGVRNIAGGLFYFPNKYKTTVLAPISEYSTVIRLSEIYLIRAEARINAGRIADGIEDINIVRKRASLAAPNALDLVPADVSQSRALQAVEDERKYELFTEWGHRWLDLKRWPSQNTIGDNSMRRADDVLGLIKPGWRREWKLYPIPLSQILNDPAMAGEQNPGYN